MIEAVNAAVQDCLEKLPIWRLPARTEDLFICRRHDGARPTAGCEVCAAYNYVVRGIGNPFVTVHTRRIIDPIMEGVDAAKPSWLRPALDVLQGDVYVVEPLVVTRPPFGGASARLTRQRVDFFSIGDLRRSSPLYDAYPELIASIVEAGPQLTGMSCCLYMATTAVAKVRSAERLIRGEP